MNTLHVVNIYFVLPYFIGDQFHFFNEKGNQQFVVCSPSEHLEDYAKKMGFRYIETEIAREINFIKDIRALVAICRFIRKNNIEIVVGHTPKGALLAMVAAKLNGVKRRIYFRHGLVYETMTGFKRWLMINTDRFTALLSTRVVCVSPSLANRSLTDHLNPPEKQIVLGRGTCGGIDVLDKFNPLKIESAKLELLKTRMNIDRDTFVIGYCGRIVRDKGISELVEAFGELQKLEIKKIKLFLVGEFEKRDSLSLNTIEHIKSNPDIIQTGFIYAGIEYYYTLFDVYILPSYREGFPTSVLEASAMEKPVLTTRVTGCIDSIIEGVTGDFIENTKEGIIQGIKDLMQNPDSKQMGIEGRKFVLENFDYRKIWPIMEKELYYQD